MTDETSARYPDRNLSWCPNMTPLTETQVKMVLSFTIGSIDRLIFAAPTVGTLDLSGANSRAYCYWDVLYEDLARTLVSLDVSSSTAGSVSEELMDRVIAIYEAAEECGGLLGANPAHSIESILSDLCSDAAAGRDFHELAQLSDEDVRAAALPLLYAEAKAISLQVTQLISCGLQEEACTLRGSGDGLSHQACIENLLLVACSQPDPDAVLASVPVRRGRDATTLG